MGKIMEIIEKRPDYKKGICSIKLLDTGFNQLTRKVGQKTGAKFMTAKTGDPLSKELLEDLNKAQLIVRDKYKPLFDSYNTWVNSKKEIVPTLETFNYTFSSLVDYSKDIVPKETFADYYLLSKIIMAEKELYEVGKFWLVNNYKNNLGKMREWSKTKKYGSCVKRISSLTLETRNGGNWSIHGHSPHIGAEITVGGPDKCSMIFSNLENIPLGGNAYIWVEYKYGGGNAFFGYQIIRQRLGGTNDDGFFTEPTLYLQQDPNNFLHRIRDDQHQKILEFTGNHSPHFNDVADVNLKHIKSRVLI